MAGWKGKNKMLPSFDRVEGDPDQQERREWPLLFIPYWVSVLIQILPVLAILLSILSTKQKAYRLLKPAMEMDMSFCDGDRLKQFSDNSIFTSNAIYLGLSILFFFSHHHHHYEQCNLSRTFNSIFFSHHHHHHHILLDWNHCRTHFPASFPCQLV
jgi:hypothetical protein